MKKLIVILGLISVLSCRVEEDCWFCSIYEWQKVYLPPGEIYPFSNWDYVNIGSEIFCGELPVSDPLYGPGIQYYCVISEN